MVVAVASDHMLLIFFSSAQCPRPLPFFHIVARTAGSRNVKPSLIGAAWWQNSRSSTAAARNSSSTEVCGYILNIKPKEPLLMSLCLHPKPSVLDCLPKAPSALPWYYQPNKPTHIAYISPLSSRPNGYIAVITCTTGCIVPLLDFLPDAASVPAPNAASSSSGGGSAGSSSAGVTLPPSSPSVFLSTRGGVLPSTLGGVGGVKPEEVIDRLTERITDRLRNELKVELQVCSAQ